MNHLSHLLDVWGAAMVRASWQAGLLALVVWAVCRVVPSIPARFQTWLWRLTLLKFFVALAWRLPVQIRVLPSQPAAAEAVPLAAGTELVAFDVLSETSTVLSSTSELSAHYGWILFLAWLAGVVCGVARIARACAAASRLRASSRATDDSHLLETTARVARTFELRSRPALLEADGQGSPLLLGIVRPAIVVPSTTLRRLDPSERELVLGHELAHHRHVDIPWSLFAACVRAVFFFHPAAWLCERKLRLAQEVAADELAMSLRRETPAEYACLLLQIVMKLGPEGTNPALSVAVVGSHQSLQERFAAMRFILPLSRRHRLTYGLLLGSFALLGVVPWVLVAAEPQKSLPAEGKKPGVVQQPGQQNDLGSKAPVRTGDENRKDREQQAASDKKPASAGNPSQLKIGKGKFVSFVDGVLTLEGSTGGMQANKGVAEKVMWTNIGETTNTYLASGEDKGPDRGYKKVATIETLKQVKPGTPVFVGPWFYGDRPGVFVGVAPAKTRATFVSYKDGSLSLLSIDGPAGSFTKKYGNSLFIQNIPANVPVEESVDGGAFQRIGTVKEVLADVAEGTVVTVHNLGEGNVTLIQLGVPKQ